MKKIISLIICVYALASCAKNADTPIGDAKIEISVSDFVDVDGILGGAKSSIAIGSGGFVFNWDYNDQIGIFPEIGDQTQQLLISVKTAKQMQSEDTYSGDLLGWQLNPDVKYSAYFPFKCDYDQKPQNIAISYEGQTQDGNGSMAGLGAYDFLTTQPVGRDGNANNSVTFKFQHIGALVRFRKQVKLDGTFTRLIVTNGKTGANAKIFPTDANVNLFGTSQVTYPTKSDTFSVALDDFTVDAQGYANIWCMFPPVDLSNETLTVTLKGAEGTADVTFKVPGRKLEGGNAYSFNKNLPVLPEGALSGEFSLASGKKIVFSKGNLWCDNTDSSNPKWYFENNQYDHRTCPMSFAHAVINGVAYDNNPSNNWGLFTWSCTAKNNQYGLTTSQGSSSDDYNNQFVEWGNNRIENGGGQPNLWRTLTQAEMLSLVYDSKNKKYKDNLYVTIQLEGNNGKVGGLMLLPDEYALAVKSNYSINDWKKAEEAGAVFFPETGLRQGTGYFDKQVGETGSISGHYWTNTVSGTNSYSLFFNHTVTVAYGSSWINANNPSSRYNGFAVRLVHEIDE